MVLAVASAVVVSESATAIFAVPSKEVPPIVLAVASAVVVAESATAILAVPSNEVPPMVLAVASAVAVAALPVTSPVNVPTNPVAVTLPVLGLYVNVPSDSSPRLPPSTSPPAVKIRALLSFVDSLSVIVTVVAMAAVPEVF